MNTMAVAQPVSLRFLLLLIAITTFRPACAPLLPGAPDPFEDKVAVPISLLHPGEEFSHLHPSPNSLDPRHGRLIPPELLRQGFLRQP